MELDSYLHLNEFALRDKLESPEFFQIICESIQEYGGCLKVLNMQEAYKEVGFDQDSVRNLNTTALCDGKTIYLHDQAYDVGGPANRLLDTLHLFGHAIAWHIKETDARALGIKFFGEIAQKIASEQQQGASEKKLCDVEEYEIEANCFLLGILQGNKAQLLERLKLNESDYAAIVKHFLDICALDTYYVIRFYRNPNLPSFQEFFEGKSPVDMNALNDVRMRITPIEPPPPEKITFRIVDSLPIPVVAGVLGKEVT